MKTSDGFTLDEQRKLKHLLDGELHFIDHPLFHPPSTAESQIFSGKEVPEPETSWYISYLNAKDRLMAWERFRTERRGKTLTREQESTLFLRFNFARFKVYTLARYLRSHRKAQSVIRQLLFWQKRMEMLRSKLVGSNLAIVVRIAERFKRSIDLHDAISIGNLKLLRAIDKFDISRGFKFSTYAWRAIVTGILREREVEARHSKVCPCTYDSDKETVEQAADDLFTQRENIEAVKVMLSHNMAGLTARELFVAKKRYLESHSSSKAYTLEEIGCMLGVSRTCIQLADQSLKRKMFEVWQKVME